MRTPAYPVTQHHLLSRLPTHSTHTHCPSLTQPHTHTHTHTHTYTHIHTHTHTHTLQPRVGAHIPTTPRTHIWPHVDPYMSAPNTISRTSHSHVRCPYLCAAGYTMRKHYVRQPRLKWALAAVTLSLCFAFASTERTCTVRPHVVFATRDVVVENNLASAPACALACEANPACCVGQFEPPKQHGWKPVCLPVRLCLFVCVGACVPLSLRGACVR